MFKRGECGITLIELSVVISIVVIMGICLAPAIGEWLEHFRIQQAARDVASALQFAKMKAISSRLEYNVVFNVTNKTYQLKRKDPSLGWTPEGNENSMPRGVAVDTNLANETCQFNPDGTCSNGTITINNQEGKTYKVVVCRTGRIKIQR